MIATTTINSDQKGQLATSDLLNVLEKDPKKPDPV